MRSRGRAEERGVSMNSCFHFAQILYSCSASGDQALAGLILNKDFKYLIRHFLRCGGSNWTWVDPIDEGSTQMPDRRECLRGKKPPNYQQPTCAMSSKQLKMYLRASFDLIPVSPSWSSGVCGRQEADVPLKSHHTSPLETHYLHLAHYSLLLLMCSRTQLALWATLG